MTSSPLSGSRTVTTDPAALDVLRVFDRIEIGPVKVEPRRIIAPYTVVGPEGTASTELIYRYEEDVFTSGEAASQNLAAMITAQVGLNYGLFCKELVFHGLFDETDQRFLRAMAENTAREIFVKKFLEENPFLRGEAAAMPIVKTKQYCRASLVFQKPSGAGDRPRWEVWHKDPKRHCVLSSGGKDSMLSYGLLHELGLEVHPLFVNESGRHWFTALNAYRGFEKTVTETGRVWTNSDRVFAWFLRQIPFIRKDFADVRADIYPIRLWTVAVFLFGVLPIMRKRHIGRLIIGDEFDTTTKVQSHGITHYDGLFDQSRYFDTALSRFFMKKGWAVSQFSILRPLSELLIQTMLSKRYPQLQQNQTSCHATHNHEGRILPCGKCEKCRRIVGMLKAIDIDPAGCGYNEEQVEACLKALPKKGIHQEEAGFQHLLHMLAEKGLIENAGYKPRAEVVSVRFDGEHAAFDDIPVDLRAGLYAIYAEHTEAFLQRKNRRWVPFDFNEVDCLKVPYPFEMETIDTPPAEKMSVETGKSSVRWAELTWKTAEERLKTIDTAILPVGAIEQHGPHLPLDVDAYDAEFLANRVAEACSDPKPLVLPMIPYGVSYHHDAFKGTISVRNESLSSMVYDIGMSLANNGIRKLVIINGHGGNDPALNYAAQMINRDSRIFVCVDTGETSDVDIEALVETPNDVHAGEIETSTTLANRPHLVNMDAARRTVPGFSSRYLDFSASRGVSWYTHTQHISEDGVMGDPTKADAEKGRLMWEIMIAHLVAFIEDLKSTPLEVLFQRRY